LLPDLFEKKQGMEKSKDGSPLLYTIENRHVINGSFLGYYYKKRKRKLLVHRAGNFWEIASNALNARTGLNVCEFHLRRRLLRQWRNI